MRRAPGAALLTALLLATPPPGLTVARAMQAAAPTTAESSSPGANSAQPDMDAASPGVDSASPDTGSAPVETGPADSDAGHVAGPSGEVLFLTCAGCHSLDPEDTLLVGPHLAGIVGREAAALADYPYSSALAEASFTWDRGVLFSWIAAAESLRPGTHMLYHNHLEPEEVFRLIDFLERNGQSRSVEQ